MTSMEALHQPALAAGAASRWAGRALAMAPQRIPAMLAAAADARALGSAAPPHADPGYALAAGGVAIVPVAGPLVARSDWLAMLFGAASYDAIGEAIEAAVADRDVRALLLDLDTPGGEVAGLFDLNDRIRAIRRECGKPLWAVANHAALSAGYLIASAAERVFVSQLGEAGSIGVVAIHVDHSGADATAGLKWTLISAGDGKTDGNPHQPLSDRAAAEMRADVEAIYARLVDAVAANRGVAAEHIRAAQAAIYRGPLAIERRLADRIGTLQQAAAELAAASRAPLPGLAGKRKRSMQDEQAAAPGGAIGEDVIQPPEAAAAQTQFGDAGTRPEAPNPAPASAEAIAAALRTEYAEIAGIVAQAGRLGVPVDAAEALARGVRADALRRTILDALAARADAADLVGIAPAGAESPVVRLARARAQREGA